MWNLENYNNKIALITDDGYEYSYNQIFRMQALFFNYIQSRQLVLIVTSNTIECVIAYISCLNNRVPCMLISNLTRKQQTMEIVKKYRPLYIWSSEDEYCPSNYKKKWGISKYSLFENNEHKKYEINNDLALLLSTSGTTGSKKFVRLSYANIYYNTISIIESLDIRKSDRAIMSLPLSYTYGLSVLNTHLMVGATVLLTEKKLVQKEFWELFDKFSITSFSGVPYSYETIKQIGIDKLHISSLRTLTQAGGKLFKTTKEYILDYSKKHGIQFFVMYGQTEATARITCLAPENVGNKIESIGLPIKGVTLKLIDEFDNVITTPYQDGEIVCYGKSVSMGYASSSFDLCRGDENSGKLYTGDIGHFDESGYYYVTGRNSRFIKIVGFRVNLDELEDILARRYGKAYCLYCDGRIYVCINNDNLNNDILEYLADKTSLHKNFFEVVKIDKIPKTPSGKVNYNHLLEYIESLLEK